MILARDVHGTQHVLVDVHWSCRASIRGLRRIVGLDKDMYPQMCCWAATHSITQKTGFTMTISQRWIRMAQEPFGTAAMHVEGFIAHLGRRGGSFREGRS